jgi:4-hydroxy-tetrahydrodipicolinate synthase
MTKHTAFTGSLPALVTPFKGGALDEAGFRALVELADREGSNGLVPVGTTGESPTLSHDEHKVVEWCIDEAKGRVPVIAGAGLQLHQGSGRLPKHAEKAGADAVLVVTPYYNKPTQEGMYQHFKAVNDAIGIPIIIYNIPPRSVVDMSVETMARLYELKNIAGVKDATANLARVSQQRHAMGPDFIQMSGEDMTALAYMAAGGHGCISVVANVAPKLCADLMSLVLKGDYAGALKVQDRLCRCMTRSSRSRALPAPSTASPAGPHQGRGTPAADDGDAADRQGDPRRHGLRRAAECLDKRGRVPPVIPADAGS